VMATERSEERPGATPAAARPERPEARPAELAAAQPSAAPLGWKAAKLVARAGVMPSPRAA
jgi:hypothetical protein